MTKLTVAKMLQHAAAEVEAVEPPDAMLLLDNAGTVFVDVREETDWREEAIPGAVSAPRGMLEFYIDDDSEFHKPVLVPPKRFIFYCGSGGRALLAARTAREMGLHASCLAGGFKAWKAASGPTVRPEDPASQP